MLGMRIEERGVGNRKKGKGRKMPRSNRKGELGRGELGRGVVKGAVNGKGGAPEFSDSDSRSTYVAQVLGVLLERSRSTGRI
jgi:hypothetical protein